MITSLSCQTIGREFFEQALSASGGRAFSVACWVSSASLPLLLAQEDLQDEVSALQSALARLTWGAPPVTSRGTPPVTTTLASSKSLVGHAEGAAGMFAALLAAVHLRHQGASPLQHLRSLNSHVR
eukprot:1181189-Prorocentrum_minimum.AAC.3